MNIHSNISELESERDTALMGLDFVEEHLRTETDQMERHELNRERQRLLSLVNIINHRMGLR